LTSIIGLNLGLVGVNVLQNQANGALFTALQQRNAPGFYRAFVIVIVLILLYLVVAVLARLSRSDAPAPLAALADRSICHSLACQPDLLSHAFFGAGRQPRSTDL
jgi:ABC-type uncharacterized transport system fused permease/ATPase subunit